MWNLGRSDIEEFSGEELEGTIDEADSELGDCRKRRRAKC